MLVAGAGLILESRVLVAVFMILLGCTVMVAAMLGKPKQAPVGLSDRLLHLLPSPLWRAVTMLMGLGILTMGTFELR